MKCLLLAGIGFAASCVATKAQPSAPAPPFKTELSRPGGANAASGDVELTEKPLDAFDPAGLSEEGKLALSLKPEKWKHAETENFILHYRRVTEAKKVAREIEYCVKFITEFLGAKPEASAGKSHVFIFEDDEEWRAFTSQTTVPAWSASYALGDDLYLNVRNSPTSGRFDSLLLAHETTHAVVARLFPHARWPLWLNEGFAEYIAGVAVAARKGQYSKRYQERLQMAAMPVAELTQLQAYPRDEVAVAQLYQTSEKVVRFLVNEHGREKVLRLIAGLAEGGEFPAVFASVYEGDYASLAEFQKKLDSYKK